MASGMLKQDPLKGNCKFSGMGLRFEDVGGFRARGGGESTGPGEQGPIQSW